MSQEAYSKYAGQVGADGVILIDETLVDAEAASHEAPVWGVPATQIAEDLGRRIVANIVMLGFFTGVTGLIPEDAMRQTIVKSVPRGTEDLNMEAFTSGVAYAGQVKVRAGDSP
jgi:2-oxoglutarate ferredoxin oxidoreductase subunit gamma